MVRLQITSNFHLLSQRCRPFVSNSADVWNQYVKMTPKARSQKKKNSISVFFSYGFVLRQSLAK